MPKSKQSKHKAPSGDPYPSSKKSCGDNGSASEAVGDRYGIVQVVVKLVRTL